MIQNENNSLASYITEHTDDLRMISQICNASPVCGKLLLQSGIVDDFFNIFQDLLKDSSTRASYRRSSYGMILSGLEDTIGSVGPAARSRRSSNLTSFLSPRNSGGNQFQGIDFTDESIPKHFSALANFFSDISHSTELKEWGGNHIIPLCLRLIPDKTQKIRSRLLEIISGFCNSCERNQELVNRHCFTLLEVLKRKEVIETRWQLFLHTLTQLKDLLAITNQISCCLIERKQAVKPKKSNLAIASNIKFMKKMVDTAASDTFLLQQGHIETKILPNICTIMYPKPISLPYTVELEITDTSNFLGNNLFIGFIENRNDHSFESIYSSYASRAVGNTEDSISFSGEYIFHLGNSYYTQSQCTSFATGDIIQAKIDTTGIVSFVYNGVPVSCDYVPSFSLPMKSTSRFYFALSVYNFSGKFNIRPISGSVLLRQSSSDNQMEKKLPEDSSALRFLRVLPIYRLPSTLQLYQLIPKILDSTSNRDDLKVTFNLIRKPDEPLPLSTSLLEIQSQIEDSLHKEIIDLEYTCMSRDASDEHDTLQNEIQQAKSIVLPTTCYPIIQLFAKQNGLTTLVQFLKRTCKFLFDPAIPQTLYILRWVYQLASHLKVPGYKEIFITNNDCLDVLLRVLQWIIRSVYATNSESNQILEKSKILRNFEYSETQLISPLEESLIELFRLPATRSQLTAIRTSVVDTQLLHHILAYMSHLESIKARQPELFDDELKGEIDQVRVVKQTKTKASTSKRYWARGTGFGTTKDKEEGWDAQKFKKQQIRKSKLLAKVFDLLGAFITIPEILHSKSQAVKNILPSEKILLFFKASALVPILESYLRNDSILDILNFIDLYQSIFSFLRAIAAHISLVPLFLPFELQNTSLLQLLETMHNNTQIVITKLSANMTKDDELKIRFTTDLELTLKQMNRAHRKLKRKGTAIVPSDSTSTLSRSEKREKKKGKPRKKKDSIFEQVRAEYQKQLEPLQYGEVSGIGNEKTYKYHDKLSLASLSKETTTRLITELSALSSNLPLHWNSSVFLTVDPTNISVMQALITGPAKTPYANGCFLFDVYCGARYPQGPPLVNLQTTGYGRIRFNPNLYKCGKVCLSLLGTWKGSQNEQWNPDTSTLLQVFVSIQALIFVEHPYFNEPSYERWIGTPMGWVSSRAYNENIRPETIRYAMVDMLRKPPAGFEEIIKIHFTLKRKEILKQVSKWEHDQVHKRNSLRVAITELKEELAKLPTL